MFIIKFAKNKELINKKQVVKLMKVLQVINVYKNRLYESQI